MPKTGDYAVCMNVADAFIAIAKECEQDVGGFLLGKMYPFAVNATFACETFMKAIMIQRSDADEFTIGHDLKKLFRALDVDDQTAITTLYEEKCAKPLSELLEESKNAFEEWRYAFEKGVRICDDGILAFAEVLQEYAASLTGWQCAFR